MHIISQFTFIISCFYICHALPQVVPSSGIIFDNMDLPDLLKTNGASVCKTLNQTRELDLLIIVNSLNSHEEERQHIRSTWGTWWVKEVKKVRIVFFVGKPSEASVESRLLLENRKHKDLVWLNVDELAHIYESVKLMAWLQWVTTQCNNTKFILTINDTAIVNVPTIMEFIKKNNDSTNTVWRPQTKCYAINRFRTSSVFCSSLNYLMSFDVVTKLFTRGVKQIKYLGIESVHLMALVATNENMKKVIDTRLNGMSITSTITFPVNVSDDSTEEIAILSYALCDKIKDHFIFLTSKKNKDEWLYLMSTFYTCLKIEKKLRKPSN